MFFVTRPLHKELIFVFIYFQRMEKHVQRAKMNINQRPKAPLPSRADQLKSLREDHVSKPDSGTSPTDPNYKRRICTFRLVW
jgi:hypothetical protein